MLDVRRPGRSDPPSIDAVLADPAVFIWLRTALRSALCRDPVVPPTIRRSWHDCWERGVIRSFRGVDYICFAHPAKSFRVAGRGFAIYSASAHGCIVGIGAQSTKSTNLLSFITSRPQFGHACGRTTRNNRVAGEGGMNMPDAATGNRGRNRQKVPRIASEEAARVFEQCEHLLDSSSVFVENLRQGLRSLSRPTERADP